ncbi:hypothetical protein DFQ27_004395 [Actinomortierella ambigua]|uniref:CID domain-containing protein n=1 Tax=Actinomortierella ambigua TaxID=1343610 RepID=A0A9P6Q577_9FUNG|nr:hypothetical protein DFQ27_004395 [Actinomortierella ambigua]
MDLDPFEARLEFLNLLSKVNASQHSIHKVGNFAMRNKNLYEDLYSCILEEMDQYSHKARFSGYIDLVRKNLASIISKVTPSGPKGDVNVAATRKVLDTWRTRKIFSESVIEQVQTPLLSRGLATKAPTAEAGLTQDDIIRRMEEDRERHKRIREEIWIRPQDEDVDGEFSQHWDDVSDMDEKDYEELVAENAKHLPGFPWTEEFDRWRSQGSKGSASALTFGSNMPAGGVPKRRKLPPMTKLSAPERTQTAQNPVAARPTAPPIPNFTKFALPQQPAANKPTISATTITTTATVINTSVTKSTRPITVTSQSSAPPSAAPPPSTNTAPPLTLKSYVEATKSPIRRLSTASSSSSISSVPTTDPNSSLSSSPMSYLAAPSPPAAPAAPAAPTAPTAPTAPVPPRLPPPPRTETTAAASSAAPPAQQAQAQAPSLNTPRATVPTLTSLSNAGSTHVPPTGAANSSNHSINHAQQLGDGGRGGGKGYGGREPSPPTPTSTTATSTPATSTSTTPASSGGSRLSLQQYLQQQRLLRTSNSSAPPSSSSSSSTSTAATSTPALTAPTSPPPPPPLLSQPASPPLDSPDVSAAAAAAAGYFPVPASSGRRPSSHGRSHSSSFS